MITVKRKSHFKAQDADSNRFREWVAKLEKANGRKYTQHSVETSLGTTCVWGLNSNDENLETIVIFPGARTTALIWDLDKGLDNLNHKMRIFLVETNGLPNLSSGNTPDIKSLGYGHWASEVFEGLKIESAFIAGASFGGLICMKLGIVAPKKVKSAFLLNPGCLQPFSMKFRNLYLNLLPIIRPTEKNVRKFLDNAVLSPPNHSLSSQAESMLIEYQILALTRYKDNTQKPYYMNAQLNDVAVDTYLLLGDNDLLFPYQKSIENAKKHLKQLKHVEVFSDVGHGIETYNKALEFIGEKVATFRMQ